MSFDSKLIISNSMVVTIDGNVYQVDSSHPNYSKLRKAVKDNDSQEFLDNVDIKESIKNFSNGVVEIVDGEVLYSGKPVDNSVVDAIQRMMNEGFDIDPMVRFLENLMKNPSYSAIQQLWKFIEVMGLTVTEDGCFLAYKTVRNDYMDKYSGTIDNRPGSKIERMERNRVSDDDNVCAGPGYHVGALGYAGPNGWYNSGQDRVVICKVNPADVVRVPKDHSYQKLVCCYYEPVADYNGEMKSSVYSGQIDDDYSTEPECNEYCDCVDEYDLHVGSTYTGYYRKANGETSKRYFMVDCVPEDNYSSYIVKLIEPEEYAGEYRNFKMDNLYDVEEYDF